MKDYELETIASEDEMIALQYIGDNARSKNIFQGKKTRKCKSDHSLPLNAFQSLKIQSL